MNAQTLPCPICQTPITFSAEGLIAGKSFSCTNCDAAISLNNNSRSTVSNAMKEFDKLRQKQSGK